MKNRHKSPQEELAHADRNLTEASFNFSHGFSEVAVRMLYYAQFHYEKALIQTRGALTKSHKQTHIQFRRLFIRTGEVDLSVSRLSELLQDAREEADYGSALALTSEEIAAYLDEVRAFGERCRQIVGDHEVDNESAPPTP